VRLEHGKYPADRILAVTGLDGDQVLLKLAIPARVPGVGRSS
jgi:hypothetical protein